MQAFTVNFSFGSSTQTQFQNTVVQANGMAQARALVEGMYGNSCQVHSVSPR